MVLIDLDGTILNNEKKIGKLDLDTLRKLGQQGVKRVFATGRTLYSSLKVLDDSIPFDYLVFSSGAGVYDWETKKLLFHSAIKKSEVLEIEKQLIEMKLNFSIHFPIPENHKYYYYRGNSETTDFDWRNNIYEGFNFKLTNGYPLDFATQFLVILTDAMKFEIVAKAFPQMKVIRATSPIDGESVWLEIFKTDVSKAKGGIFLCEKLKIDQQDTLSIGNDYNDIDLLEWTNFSYVVDTSPAILKEKYNYCCDNQSNPLTFVYYKHWD